MTTSTDICSEMKEKKIFLSGEKKVFDKLRISVKRYEVK